jgi:hypothetical protein
MEMLQMMERLLAKMDVNPTKHKRMPAKNK